MCQFVKHQYGDAQIVSTTKEGLQKSSVNCTTVQSLRSLGNGKNILLRIYNRKISNCIIHNALLLLIVQIKMASQLQ